MKNKYYEYLKELKREDLREIITEALAKNLKAIDQNDDIESEF